ncbi:MAG TPA: hypothetical protein VKV39_13925 [Candidatus Sulfotelmatobacter sp.]|nr:hypothetical protein [Candidatus Sulfotelmatobacter sp.]
MLTNISRTRTLLLAGVVIVLTFAVAGHAAQTITTPNEAVFNYNLAAGASSAAVTPASNTPVLVQGVQTTLGYRGVGHVSMLHVPSSFLEWTGLESPAAAAITSGFSGTAGTHIVYLDFSHLVDIRVNGPDTFVVHNANTIEQTGVVTLIW